MGYDVIRSRSSVARRDGNGLIYGLVWHANRLERSWFASQAGICGLVRTGKPLHNKPKTIGFAEFKTFRFSISWRENRDLYKRPFLAKHFLSIATSNYSSSWEDWNFHTMRKNSVPSECWELMQLVSKIRRNYANLRKYTLTRNTGRRCKRTRKRRRPS